MWAWGVIPTAADSAAKDALVFDIAVELMGMSSQIEKPAQTNTY